MSGDVVLGILFVVAMIVLVGAVLVVEEMYYTRHPEKERPDPDPRP